MTPRCRLASLPSHIRLLSQTITVEAQQEVVGNDHEGHEAQTYGVFYENDNRMVIATGDVGQDRLRETVLHELLHAMFSLTNLDETLTRSGGSGLDEHVVTVLAPVMLDFVRANPVVVAWLRETA